MRTDKLGELAVNFYEKTLVEPKAEEVVNQERQRAFEQKYLNKISVDYQNTLNTLPKDSRQEKEKQIADSFAELSRRLSAQEGLEFDERQQAILKLKLARHFQKATKDDVLDINTLFDAIIESPKFIDTDKGSLFRLLEVHEQKTLEKIAEMRKKRAEIGKDETFNPYENMFTTESGNYYVARLLNMPHLEQESEYMKHCVGTSTSYVNRIKKGEIEIFSFRNVPNINTQTQKLEGDMPIITIEYNLKTKTIQQIKKYDDKYLEPDDPYFADVVDALKQLRHTTTDTGERRDFSKISPSELGNIKVKDYYVLTDQGEISFQDFDPDADIFILKSGKMDITLEHSKQDIAKIVRIVEGISCQPNEIAQSKDEVTPKTKLWLAPLFPDFFDWLQDHDQIEHIYTSFPENKITKFEALMGDQTKEELLNELEQRKSAEGDDQIFVEKYADFMLNSDEFETLPNREIIKYVRLKVSDLGFSDGATTQQIYDKAEEFGLELCPAETGPKLRLNYKKIFKSEQSRGDYFMVAMKQIPGSAGYPSVFSVSRDGDGESWLDGRAGSAGGWNSGDEFVFRVSPRLPSLKATA